MTHHFTIALMMLACILMARVYARHLDHRSIDDEVEAVKAELSSMRDFRDRAKKHKARFYR